MYQRQNTRAIVGPGIDYMQSLTQKKVVVSEEECALYVDGRERASRLFIPTSKLLEMATPRQMQQLFPQDYPLLCEQFKAVMPYKK